MHSNSFQSQYSVKPNCCFTRRDIKLASGSEQTVTTTASMKKKRQIIFSDSHCLRLAITPSSWLFSMSFRATWSSHFLLLCLLPLYPWQKLIMVVSWLWNPLKISNQVKMLSVSTVALLKARWFGSLLCGACIFCLCLCVRISRYSSSLPSS